MACTIRFFLITYYVSRSVIFDEGGVCCIILLFYKHLSKKQSIQFLNTVVSILSMSNRNWKSSNTRRRTAAEVGSVGTSSTSSTQSVSNRTVNTTNSSVLPGFSSASINEKGSGSASLNQRQNKSILADPETSSHLGRNRTGESPTAVLSSHYGPTEYIYSNPSSGASVVSALSSASSTGTYDFAFLGSSSQSDTTGKRQRNKKTEKLPMTFMPTLNENDPDSDSNFLDNFLSSGGDMKKSNVSTATNGAGDTSKVAAYSQKGGQALRHAKFMFQKLASTLSNHLDSQQQNRQLSNLPSSKYVKHNQVSRFSPQKWLVSLLKLLVFGSLVITGFMSLRLASKNQPDLLDPYAKSSGSQSLKDKLIRRNNYPNIQRPNNVDPELMEGNYVNPMTMMQNRQQQQQQQLQQQFHPQIIESKAHEINPKHIGVRIPPPFLNLVDIDEFPVLRGQDLPFYWHIPRAGGTMMNEVLGSCIGLQLAADAGGRNGHDQDKVCYSSPVKCI